MRGPGQKPGIWEALFASRHSDVVSTDNCITGRDRASACRLKLLSVVMCYQYELCYFEKMAYVNFQVWGPDLETGASACLKKVCKEDKTFQEPPSKVR